MSSTAERKADERRVKLLREFQRSSEENKRCFSCREKGPQYICVDFGTFVCTTCSGIHREFSHRVKSISMSKFADHEIGDIIGDKGNERARDKWLVGYNPKDYPPPTSQQRSRIREFIRLCFIDERWMQKRQSERSSRHSERHEDEDYAQHERRHHRHHRRSRGNHEGSGTEERDRRHRREEEHISRHGSSRSSHSTDSGDRSHKSESSRESRHKPSLEQNGGFDPSFDPTFDPSTRPQSSSSNAFDDWDAFGETPANAAGSKQDATAFAAFGNEATSQPKQTFDALGFSEDPFQSSSANLPQMTSQNSSQSAAGGDFWAAPEPTQWGSSGNERAPVDPFGETGAEFGAFGDSGLPPSGSNAGLGPQQRTHQSGNAFREPLESAGGSTGGQSVSEPGVPSGPSQDDPFAAFDSLSLSDPPASSHGEASSNFSTASAGGGGSSLFPPGPNVSEPLSGGERRPPVAPHMQQAPQGYYASQTAQHSSSGMPAQYAAGVQQTPGAFYSAQQPHVQYAHYSQPTGQGYGGPAPNPPHQTPPRPGQHPQQGQVHPGAYYGAHPGAAGPQHGGNPYGYGAAPAGHGPPRPGPNAHQPPVSAPPSAYAGFQAQGYYGGHPTPVNAYAAPGYGGLGQHGAHPGNAAVGPHGPRHGAQAPAPGPPPAYGQSDSGSQGDATGQDVKGRNAGTGSQGNDPFASLFGGDTPQNAVGTSSGAQSPLPSSVQMSSGTPDTAFGTSMPSPSFSSSQPQSYAASSPNPSGSSAHQLQASFPPPASQTSAASPMQNDFSDFSFAAPPRPQQAARQAQLPQATPQQSYAQPQPPQAPPAQLQQQPEAAPAESFNPFDIF